MVLSWNGGRSKLTVPIDPSTNVATFLMAPDYDTHRTFVQEAGLLDDSDPTLDDDLPNLVSDDEDNDEEEDDDISNDVSEVSEESEGVLEVARTISFDFTPDDGLTSETMDVDTDEEDHLQNLAGRIL